MSREIKVGDEVRVLHSDWPMFTRGNIYTVVEVGTNNEWVGLFGDNGEGAGPDPSDLTDSWCFCLEEVELVEDES